MESMDFIPRDILRTHILMFLDLKDLARLCQTNSSVRAFLLDYCDQVLAKGVLSQKVIDNRIMNSVELLHHLHDRNSLVSCTRSATFRVLRDGRVSTRSEGQREWTAFALEDAAVSVTCGHSHTLMLSSAGKVYGLGSNANAELGVRAVVEEGMDAEMAAASAMTDRPVQLPIEEAVVQMVAGDRCSAFLTADRQSIYFCGDIELLAAPVEVMEGDDGENAMMDVEEEIKKLDTTVLEGAQIRSICLGAKHLVVVDEHNRVFTAGSNTKNQLGRDCTDQSPLALGQVIFPEIPGEQVAVIKVDAGVHHTLVLLGNGQVYGFGTSNTGELGLPNHQDALTPILVPAPSRILNIACGHHHSLLFDVKGQVLSFGLGVHGQLGYACSFWCSSLPTASATNTEIRYLAASDSVSLLMTQNGDLQVSGRARYCLGAIPTKDEVKRDTLARFVYV